MRVAAIDLGTNTALLLIAEQNAHGDLVALAERATITRLGEGVDRTRQLAPTAIARTKACLDDFAALIAKSSVETIAVVGTSAMRDAGGGAELRAYVRTLLGVDVRVLAGQEEARLSFCGALHGLPVEQGKPCDVAVFDIGGGSTEVVIGRRNDDSPELRFAESFDVGSVRLTERFVAHDPPTPVELAAVARSAGDAFRELPDLPPGALPVGVAGTVTTLTAIALGIEPYDPLVVHGQKLGREVLRGVVERLTMLSREARQRVRGMEPKRADIIIAGGLVALALLDRWDAPALIVSDRGVRWGLAEELVRSPLP